MSEDKGGGFDVLLAAFTVVVVAFLAYAAWALLIAL
jgi:hypothetical protein